MKAPVDMILFNGRNLETPVARNCRRQEEKKWENEFDLIKLIPFTSFLPSLITSHSLYNITWSTITILVSDYASLAILTE